MRGYPLRTEKPTVCVTCGGSRLVSEKFERGFGSPTVTVDCPACAPRHTAITLPDIRERDTLEPPPPDDRTDWHELLTLWNAFKLTRRVGMLRLWRALAQLDDARAETVVQVAEGMVGR